jgi:hypothetical protein
MIFRDSERGERISVAVCSDLKRGIWAISDLTATSVGMWEPSHDPVVWKKKKTVHLFVQTVGQGQQEGIENISAQMVSILEWRPRLIGKARAISSNTLKQFNGNTERQR